MGEESQVEGVMEGERLRGGREGGGEVEGKVEGVWEEVAQVALGVEG